MNVDSTERDEEKPWNLKRSRILPAGEAQYRFRPIHPRLKFVGNSRAQSGLETDQAMHQRLLKIAEAGAAGLALIFYLARTQALSVEEADQMVRSAGGSETTIQILRDAEALQGEFLLSLAPFGVDFAEKLT